MTKSELLKELKIIYNNLDKACKRSEKLAHKISVPSHSELHFIREEVKQLIEMGKSK